MLISVLGDKMRILLEQRVEIHKEVLRPLAQLTDDSGDLREAGNKRKLEISSSDVTKSNSSLKLTGIECE